jgi:uncharacterized protein YbjQ (UPF0145 family)
MKILRNIGSLAFVLGLFTAIFVGVPWGVITSDDPVIPWWLRTAVFCLLGGMLVVLATLALESKGKVKAESEPRTTTDREVLLLNTDEIPGRQVSEILGLVQGHTVFAVWLGKDLSAIARLILGGELTEYTEMMGQARITASERMVAQAGALGADAVINVRYMTTSVVGSAAELLVYGTAVKLT